MGKKNSGKKISAEDIHTEFVNALATMKNRTLGGAEPQEVKKIAEEYRPQFAQCNVDIHICCVLEISSTPGPAGQKETHNKVTKWITYVDRAVAPKNYKPKHVWDG
eukprot:NODE_6986_length_470_cov_65.050602.p1 GENE.NODE_6986_length_470_cov_65.050602~~NODE_6986_length_470_cov_65.050602.p1  ORF type:complete len:106 (+),score=31.26 NODE_6986_length_470_cov_65.050602:3-320(+)